VQNPLSKMPQMMQRAKALMNNRQPAMTKNHYNLKVPRLGP
jgi:hypothetical protein